MMPAHGQRKVVFTVKSQVFQFYALQTRVLRAGGNPALSISAGIAKLSRSTFPKRASLKPGCVARAYGFKFKLGHEWPSNKLRILKTSTVPMHPPGRGYSFPADATAMAGSNSLGWPLLATNGGHRPTAAEPRFRIRSSTATPSAMPTATALLP